MRKIESQMLNAIASLKDFNSANTTVTHGQVEENVDGPGFTYADVMLHGHNIATVYHPSTSEEYVTVNLKTLRWWPTVTTKSRLRALGVNVATRKGITYVNNVAI